MDKKSKILFVLLFIAILASAGITYYRYMILRQYDIFLDSSNVPSSFDILKSLWTL